MFNKLPMISGKIGVGLMVAVGLFLTAGVKNLWASSPPVMVIAPPDGAIVSAEKIMLIGRVGFGETGKAYCSIDGKKKNSLKTDKKGRFGCFISLSPGENMLEIGGKDLTPIFINITRKTSPGEFDQIYRYHPGTLDGQCPECHRNGTKGQGKDQTALCYRCHPTFDDMKFVHGPMGSGECTPCHDPHGSAYPSFNRADDKEMCLICHDPERIEPHYKKTKKLRCLNCHNPHGSNKEFHVR